jgi:SEC-C motif-containing protein
MSCPCGLPAEYEACCGRFHAGEPAPTAEALMRSRYSAFARGLWSYLAATQVSPFAGPASVEHWVGLTVHRATQDEVEFTARYVERDHEISLSERSKFECAEGRWRYVSGTPTVSTRKLSRNEQCPCGSGKKVKACGVALASREPFLSPSRADR